VHLCHPVSHIRTGWRRPIGCLRLQVIYRKRATNYRAVLRKMTCKDKASYDSTPPCISHTYQTYVSHIRITHTYHAYVSHIRITHTYHTYVSHIRMKSLKQCLCARVTHLEEVVVLKWLLHHCLMLCHTCTQPQSVISHVPRDLPS